MEIADTPAARTAGLANREELRSINGVLGYRIYFGKDGETLVILLGGGTKKGQDRDIARAHARWQDYKKRRSRGK